MMPALYQITLQMPPAQAELFAALFEETALAVSVHCPPRQALARVEAIYDTPPDAAHWQALVTELAADQGIAAPSCTVAALPPTDWLQQVAVIHAPRTIGRLVIHGAPDAARVPFYQPRLQIEAATAFGTGEHPSTQMCLLLLQNLLKRTAPRRCLDIGCGSGILALAYTRFTHHAALAVDCDAESVRMTRHNARVNGLPIRALIGQGYAPRSVRQGRPYDLVFANIFARPLMLLAADLRRHLAPGGYAILAGLLTTQVPMVLAAHRLQRLHLVQKLSMGEWSALLLQRGRG